MTPGSPHVGESSGGDLVSTAAALCDEFSLPGIAVGTVRADGATTVATAGHADVVTRRPVTHDTVFRIGSVTKPLTALSVLQCVDDGAFALDDPVSDHLRSFDVTGPPGSPAGPTVRQLCTHTGGFGEWIASSDLWRRPLRVATGVPRGWRMPSLAEVYGPVVATAGVPGRVWTYSNHGYAVLGQLVADVAGDAFATVLAERTARSLGMRDTTVARTAAVDERLAIGYRPGGRRPAPFFDVLVAGAGGVYSTPRDLVRFAAALAGHTGDADDAAVARLRRMQDLQHAVHPALPGIGLAFMLRRIGGHRIVAHGGSVPGFGTALVSAPDAGVAVFVCTNENATSPIVNTAEIAADRLLHGLLGVPAASPSAPVASVPEAPVEPCGRWVVPPDPRLHARAWQHHGGEITVTAGGPDGYVLRSALGALRGGVRVVPDAVHGDGGSVVCRGEGSAGPVTAVWTVDAGDGSDVLFMNGAPVPLRFVRASGPTRRTRLAVAAAVGVGASAGMLSAGRVLSRR